jgi:hypothetical protein
MSLAIRAPYVFLMRYHWTLTAVPTSCVHDRWLRSVESTPGGDGARLARETSQANSVRQRLSPIPIEATMRAVSLLAVAASLASPLSAQSSCKLEGVWELVSGTADGKPYPAGNRGLKIITKGHFAVLGREPGPPQAMKSQADSLRVLQKTSSGGGTYRARHHVHGATGLLRRPGVRRESGSVHLSHGGRPFLSVGHLPGPRRWKEGSRHHV